MLNPPHESPHHAPGVRLVAQLVTKKQKTTATVEHWNFGDTHHITIDVLNLPSKKAGIAIAKAVRAMVRALR